MLKLPDLVKESTRAIKLVVSIAEPDCEHEQESDSETDSDYEPGHESDSETDSDESETEPDLDRKHHTSLDLKRKTDDRYSLDDEYQYTHTLDDVSSHRNGKTITASDVGLYQSIRQRVQNNNE
jgi:hypothetical protein